MADSRSSSYFRYAGNNALVTGGTGFIGRHLVHGLVDQGAQVRVLARRDGYLGDFPDSVEFCRGSLENITSLERACQGVAIVFHAAGYAHAWSDASTSSRELHHRVNVEGTRRLLQAAARGDVKRFVFLSSVKAMGPGGEKCLDETWPLPPETPYGISKREAEQEVLDLGRNRGIHVVNLRLALVYGPGGRGNLERMITAINKDLFPPLPRVSNKRSMVHVKDVVQAALQAGSRSEANQQTYIVTDGYAYSGREIYEMICRALGKPIPRWYVPHSVLRSVALAGDMLGRMRGKRVMLDSDALDKILGWACYCSDKIRVELDYRPTLTLAEALPVMVRK